MTKHTPGPWSVAETRHKYDTLIRNRDNDPVASTNFAGYSPKTAAANARLIAAAPDLLAACREFVAKVDRGEARSRFTYARMKDAIAKAEPE